MKIENMLIKDIKPYERNPRKNDDAVDFVANSIESFGFRVPIVIDTNNIIVAGHTRYKAAKKLGLKTVPVVVADELTEEQVTAFRLVDNKTQELSSWDFSKLVEELTALVDDFDMSKFGFAPIGNEDNGAKAAEQNLDEGEELNLDDFENEQFSCTCPSCGFKFND
jgi:ParB/RepB/Spo0J family partition protein